MRRNVLLILQNLTSVPTFFPLDICSWACLLHCKCKCRRVYSIPFLTQLPAYNGNRKKVFWGYDTLSLVHLSTLELVAKNKNKIQYLKLITCSVNFPIKEGQKWICVRASSGIVIFSGKVYGKSEPTTHKKMAWGGIKVKIWRKF